MSMSFQLAMLFDTAPVHDDMHQLQQLHGSDFEVVDTSGLVNG